jgi:hypothetical protein
MSEMDLREFPRDVTGDTMLLKDGLVTLLAILPVDTVLDTVLAVG